MNFSQIELFVVAALVLLLTPGPSVLYIVTRSVSQGKGAGIASVLGVQFGAMVHVVAAALGISAIVLSSAAVFEFVKYAGAAYLIYLGIRALTKKAELNATEVEAAPLRSIFNQGIWVAALNPKTAIFFIAFLPQFVDTSRGNVPTQLFLLGMIYVSISVVVDSLYALLAGAIRPWLVRSPKIWQRERLVSGFVYIALGIITALGSKPAAQKN